MRDYFLIGTVCIFHVENKGSQSLVSSTTFTEKNHSNAFPPSKIAFLCGQYQSSFHFTISTLTFVVRIAYIILCASCLRCSVCHTYVHLVVVHILCFLISSQKKRAQVSLCCKVTSCFYFKGTVGLGGRYPPFTTCRSPFIQCQWKMGSQQSDGRWPLISYITKLVHTATFHCNHTCLAMSAAGLLNYY